MFTKQATEERKQIYALLQQSRKLLSGMRSGRPCMDLDTAITLGWRGLRKLSFDRGGRLAD
jgi:hypothetical protein